ncbi:SpoIIE family protein phosphatase [Vibrio anguillarum]|uniref:ATP-binding SpoIIE family protein phosphatase n=1 Tax=Vibrio TaxID=662 RepID=UPI0002F745DC|nr:MULTISPECIES: SpoIIE family protein phosphatase [Vibrio]MCC4235897.1 SpoIIE family protein phosphatase [Vibrio anguillarum]MDQ2164379.1 fused response regulator/phosphatase [Vibrio anguillarum]MDT3847587.1 SpoIIE family protein phosphatase [Vibrio anguillarum]NNN95783.1 fused response regulator/phosphatase [Vibrio sp. B4-6]NNO00203.1 fused response regulator/phosphatase [Vibrio sp. B1-2]
MRVTIVDDHKSNRELCRFILLPIAEHIDTFENGADAVEAMLVMDVLPDVILLDVMMPVKDGFTTAKEIRDSFPNHHIPIIFLTVLDDHDSFERCLSLGDDFILKPVERSVLLAKVQAHYRIVKMHNEVTQQRDKLNYFNEQVQYDYAIAESIFTNLMEEMSAKVNNIYGISYISTPSTIFNGDLIIVANRPYGGVYVMIADATGHGLPAAISTIPATRTFFSMAEKGMSLGEMVAELNSALVKFLPVGMMLAASVFEIRANGFEVSWWGGGLPDGYLLDEESNIVRRLVSTHMPLGVLDADEFEVNLVHLKLKPNQTILCYTDGITEAMNENGEQFGQLRLEQVLQRNVKTQISDLYDEVCQFSNRGHGDDLSILSMTFPITNNNEILASQKNRFLSHIPMQSHLFFPASILKKISVMVEMRNIVRGFISGGEHLDLVCSVLSELFANAIEHGLLKLNSSLKDDPDGFLTFYQRREECMDELDESLWIKLDIDYDPTVGQLSFSLEHNGEGFEYQHTVADGNCTHGRGIILVSKLCESLEYSKNGCTVKVTYAFNSKHDFPILS